VHRRAMSLQGLCPFAVGTNVLIRITKNDKVCSPKGPALHSTVRMGMGVEFTSVVPGEGPVLERWLAESSGELPAEELPAEELEFFGRLTSVLVRKRVLTEVEGNAMLGNFSRNKKLY
jgi:hypothetical protein